jgi:hypothetical protein
MEYKDDRIYGFGFRAHVDFISGVTDRYVVFVYELPVGGQRTEIIAKDLTHTEAAIQVQQLTNMEMERRTRVERKFVVIEGGLSDDLSAE